MDERQDLASVARSIVDANLYMVLGTADSEGRPWVSPVYFAHADYREFFWVSSPEATHSRNLRARRELSIVIFDSTVPISTGQGVYMSAVGEQLGADESEALGVFSARVLAHGGGKFGPEAVQAPARLRLYRASAVEHYVLDELEDRRIPVTP
jgi:Pyridoxamine 5'-phosphate oxidase